MLRRRRSAVTIGGVERWEPADDLSLIIGTLMKVSAQLDEIGEHVVAIRSLLEDEDDEEEAEED